MRIVHDRSSQPPSYRACFDDGSEVELSPLGRLIVSKMARRQRLDAIRDARELAAAVEAYCVKRARFFYHAAVVLPLEMPRLVRSSPGVAAQGEPRAREAKRVQRTRPHQSVSCFIPTRRRHVAGAGSISAGPASPRAPAN